MVHIWTYQSAVCASMGVIFPLVQDLNQDPVLQVAALSL